MIYTKEEFFMSYMSMTIYNIYYWYNMSISLPIAEWLEGHARKQGVAGSIPGGGIHYHFEIFANGMLFTSRRRPYK